MALCAQWMFDSVAPVPQAESQLGGPEESVGVNELAVPTSLVWGDAEHLLWAGTGPEVRLYLTSVYIYNRLYLHVPGDLLRGLH